MDKNKIAIATYEKFAPKYTELYFTDQTDFPFVEKMFITKLPQQAKVLDVGCGPGNFTQLLSQKGFKVTGIDLTKAMLKIAKEKVPEVNFKLMDMRKLDYPPGTFDGILSAYSLIHIPSDQIQKTLEGLKRVLKPSGLLFIICQKGKANHVVDDPDMPSEKMFLNFFIKNRLNKFLTKAGFTILAQEEATIPGVSQLSQDFIYTLARSN